MKLTQSFKDAKKGGKMLRLTESSGTKSFLNDFSVSDTVSRVIHPAARRARGSSPQPTVNNSAATKNLRPGKQVAGRIALRGSRSSVPGLTKTSLSLPAPSAAAVRMSERTTACEASSRMTPDSAAVRAIKSKNMKPWTEITHYAGFDWARDHHDVVIVDRQGQIVADCPMLSVHP